MDQGQEPQPSGDGKDQGSIFIGTDCSACGYLGTYFLEARDRAQEQKPPMDSRGGKETSGTSSRGQVKSEDCARPSANYPINQGAPLHSKIERAARRVAGVGSSVLITDQQLLISAVRAAGRFKADTLSPTANLRRNLVTVDHRAG